MKRKVKILGEIDRQVVKRRGSDLVISLTKTAGVAGMFPPRSKIVLYRTEGGFFIETLKKNRSHDLTWGPLPRYEADDGPISEYQLEQIIKSAPTAETTHVIGSLFDVEDF